MKAIPIILLCLIAPVPGEIARWADDRIPLTDGLALWFDATRENEAREAHYMNRLADGQAMDFWHDSSGNSRHLAQWSAAFRPRWSGGAAEFGGDDYLAALLVPGLESRACTMFVVASPDGAAGDFPALFSSAGREGDDFTGGLTLDFGREAGRGEIAEIFNVEGAGQSGERNLLAKPLPADRGHLFTVTSAAGESRLRVDAENHGRRERGDVAFAMDRIAVGARFVEPAMRHFFRGRIAEVVFFNRKLDDGEIAKVEAWLTAKHAGFLRPPDPNLIQPEPAKDAPLVQMLVPGFRVDELKVETTNLNNIEYAPDGRLFAGGYDGRFHLLRDTDGDGIEDKLDTFSPGTSDNYPLGMVVKDGMPHALLSDEIIRFRDTDNDGIPDRRETVVKGWDDPQLRDDPDLMHRRVDSALALAAGPDGSWYVTMGSANPGNGYWQKAEGDVLAPDAVKTGKPGYSTDKRRGCLLKISSDGKVEQLSSGLRYVMSLQWDRHGELFGTDQEGATWLPNGNPFDELLHLQSGRHYGFPPRHPKLLPDVIDEPSVWDYAPQHQSTCGFRFNGPAENRARFGPEFWAHDALVTGESRGKLWRTTLAKTAAGYVARNQLVACAGMLVTDCAISPQGDLVICCHSGPPDWGRGPSHPGKLFKIRYVDPALPQPLLVRAINERQFVVEFDRALPTTGWSGLAKRIRIRGGPHVAAGDRFESIRPGYAVVHKQLQEPAFDVTTEDVGSMSDGRSMIIQTPPRTVAVNYAISIDWPRLAPGRAIDLACDLNGLAVEWSNEHGASWSRANEPGWWPHVDLEAVEVFGRGSGSIATGLKACTQPGTLVLRTKLDLANLLQPKVQPGSRLDYTPEPELVTVTVRSDAPVTLTAAGATTLRQGPGESSFTKAVGGDPWQDIEITVQTPAKRLAITWRTARDPRERPFSTARFLMPFATMPETGDPTASVPEIAGGDREKGKALYHGKATCFTCHTIHGEGQAVGPDLSNTRHRDHASVLRDIQDPNASINPDAIAYQVTLKSGGIVLGTRIGETEAELKLAAPGGAVTAVKKADIASTAALPVSLMPPGLLASLSEQEIKDLMTFLLTEPAAKDVGSPGTELEFAL